MKTISVHANLEYMHCYEMKSGTRNHKKQIFRSQKGSKSISQIILRCNNPLAIIGIIAINLTC